MSRVYILDATTLGVIGLVDQSFSKLVYTRRYQAADTFTLEINSRRLYADKITNGCLIYLPDDGNRVFLVEQIETTREGTLAKDLMTVTGRSLEGISMVERRCIPPVGSAYDSVSSAAAETAIKHYVNANAVSAVDSNRNIPNLQIVADSGRGVAVNVDARYQAVMDICAQIGILAGMGWEVTFDPAAKKFNFDVIVGHDYSASVFFDFTFETLAKWDALDSALDSKTVAIVAGQGEGVSRDIVTRGSASGFNRREAFIDARDVTQGSTAVLNTRGDAFLAQASISKSIDATVHQFGSFQYMRDWDLGDIILVRDAQSGTSYSARVIEIEVTIKDTAASPTVVATLGKPWPTIQSQLGDSSSSAGGTADAGGASIAGIVAGGDLSGTYPNPSVVNDSHNHTAATLPALLALDSTAPTTQAFGDAAAAGSATTAAHRDHKHGMPAAEMPAHLAASDPHSQYALDTDLAAHAADDLDSAHMHSITPNSSSTYAGQWTKIGSGSISAQYGDVTLLADVTGNATASYVTNYRLFCHVKQQVAFGGQPYVEVVLIDIHHPDRGVDGVKVNVTSVAGPTTFDVYMRNDLTYQVLHVDYLQALLNSSTWTPLSNQSYVAAIPGGGTVYTSIDDLATSAPGAESFGVAGAAGTSTTPARSDHTHAMPANPVPATGAAGDIADVSGVVTTQAGGTGKHADAGHAHKLTIPVTQNGAASSAAVTVATSGWARQQNPSPSFVPAYTGQKFLIFANISGAYSAVVPNLMCALLVDNDLSGTVNAYCAIQQTAINAVNDHANFTLVTVWTAAAGDVGQTRYARVGFQGSSGGTWTPYAGSSWYSCPILIAPIG